MKLNWILEGWGGGGDRANPFRGCRYGYLLEPHNRNPTVKIIFVLSVSIRDVTLKYPNPGNHKFRLKKQLTKQNNPTSQIPLLMEEIDPSTVSDAILVGGQTRQNLQ